MYDPADVVLVRPVETWTEDGRKRSRVVYPAVAYPTAGELAGDFRRWAGLQRVAAAERANLFFGVCLRFGPGHYDLSWQVRTVQVLWADLDHCPPDEAVRRCGGKGLPAPAAVVSSGNGSHLYWRLADPVRGAAPAPLLPPQEFVDDRLVNGVVHPPGVVTGIGSPADVLGQPPLFFQ